MIKLIKNFTLKDLFLLLLSTAIIAFSVYLDLKIPDYMSEITRLVKTEGTNINSVLNEGYKMLLCALGSLVSAVIVGYIITYVSATYSKNLRKKLFKNIESFGMEEMKKFQTGSLITRTTNDITNIQMFIAMGMQLLIKAPITAVLGIIKILNKNLTWSVITGGCVLIMLTVIIILMITVIPKFKTIQKLIDNINSLMKENLTGIRVVRAFNAEKYQYNKFNKVNKELTDVNEFTQKSMSIISPVMYLIMNILTLAIYFIGSSLIYNGSLSMKISLFSDMVVFTSYAMQIIMSFLMLAIIFIMYPRTSVSLDRIDEVLKTKSKIVDGPYKKPTKKHGEIEFKNVSFRYPDSEENVLTNISFKVEKGKTLAFIGRTGSGKSTLINLIPRFYDVTEGSILIDGVDIRKYNLKTLHNKIGYVSQKALMFNDTIKNNIAYGTTAKGKITSKKIKYSLVIAEANEFVTKLKGGTSYSLAESGSNVSGGQKQRISIARAIARKP